MQLPNWRVLVFVFNAIITLSGVGEIVLSIYYGWHVGAILGCFMVGLGLGSTMFIIDCVYLAPSNEPDESKLVGV